VKDKDIPIDAEFVDNLLHDIYQTFEITDKNQQEKVKQNLPENSFFYFSIRIMFIYEKNQLHY